MPEIQHYRATTLLAIAIALIPVPSISDTTAKPVPTDTTTIEPGKLPRQFGLEVVTVTATRNPMVAFDYPGMVSVLGGEGIRQRQSSSIDDLLQFIPNVEFTGGPRRTGETPSIRGFSGADVIVTFDGARQNFGSAHDGRFFIDPSLIREIEVLRGPASSLYGSGGTGGVIELRTVKAEDLLTDGKKLGLDVSAGYQDVNDELTATITAYGKPGAGIDLLASVVKRASDDIELGDGGVLRPSEDDILSTLAKASFVLSTHQTLEASLLSFANDATEPNNGQGLGGDSLVDKDIRSTTLRASYHYTNPNSILPDVDLTLYRTASEADERRLDTHGAGPAGELLRRDVDTTGIRFDLNSEIASTENFAALLTYGAEAYRDEQDGAAGNGERDGVPDAESDFYGLFLQAEVEVSDPTNQLPGRFLLIPGLRYDDYQTKSDLGGDNSDHELSPRFSVSYLPTEGTMLFVSYARAFRAPTFDELYLTGNHFVIPLAPGVNVINRFASNPDLKPQRTTTFEYGGGLKFDNLLGGGDHLEMKASHFRTRGEDFIDLSVIQPALFIDCNPFFPPGACDGNTVSKNIADAKLWGTELELAYDTAQLRVRLGYSAINGKDEATNDKLGILSPDQLSLDTALKLPAWDTTIGWRVLAAKHFDEVNTASDERDGYAVHDLYFSWQPNSGMARRLRVDLGVDNLFDKSYERVFTGAAEPGRNFKVRISYSFL